MKILCVLAIIGCVWWVLSALFLIFTSLFSDNFIYCYLIIMTGVSLVDLYPGWFFINWFKKDTRENRLKLPLAIIVLTASRIDVAFVQLFISQMMFGETIQGFI